MHPKTTPKDFFLWAGAMISLFGSIIAFISLMFSYINYAFPDPLNYFSSDPYQNGASYEMSSFITLGALCLVLLRVIHRSIQKDSTCADIWVRRWALFLTLFVAGAAITVDLIVLLTTFLNGDELTTRFLLKVLVVLLVASAGFMHFLADLWGYWVQNPKLSMRVTWGVGALGILTIIAGFFILGTPQHARLLRLDQQKVYDLQNIQSQVINYYQAKQKLPQSLTDLNNTLSYSVIPLDPQTGSDYDYHTTTPPYSFELCANFNATGAGNQYPNRSVPAEPATMHTAGGQDNWSHGAGNYCFERTIDPQLYPPVNQPTPKVPQAL